MVAIIFLGMAATSTFRRNVTRQLQTLLHHMLIVDVAESAIAEVAQQEKLVEAFRDPTRLDALRRAFREGEYKGGVLFPAEIPIAIEPAAIKQRYSVDERVRIGDVELIPLQYKPNPMRQTGLMRFQVGVTMKEGKREFARKVAADYEFSVFEGDDPGTLQFLLSRAPMAKVYP
jgi:hypothetical protein